MWGFRLERQSDKAVLVRGRGELRQTGRRALAEAGRGWSQALSATLRALSKPRVGSPAHQFQGGGSMRRKLGIVAGVLLVGLALHTVPASGTCAGACFNVYKACRAACGTDPDCPATCGDNFEACRCGCGICP
jgi:hypothetical protein